VGDFKIFPVTRKIYDPTRSPARPHPKERGKKLNQAMKLIHRRNEKGAMGYILLWLIGIPVPVLLLIFLLRGCT